MNATLHDMSFFFNFRCSAVSSHVVVVSKTKKRHTLLIKSFCRDDHVAVALLSHEGEQLSSVFFSNLFTVGLMVRYSSAAGCMA